MRSSSLQLAKNNARHAVCGSAQHKPRQILDFGATCKNCNKLHHFHKSLPALCFYGTRIKMATTASVQKNNFEMTENVTPEDSLYVRQCGICI